MAKTPKLKTKPKSLNSRAARRASSPSLNLDKSLKNLPQPDENSKSAPNPLSARHGSSIMKKRVRTSKAQRSRAQLLRLKKGVEKAEKVLDRTEKKVEKSKGRETVVKERSSNWEDLNEKIAKSEELVGKVGGGPRVKKVAKAKNGEDMEGVEVENGDLSAVAVSVEDTTMQEIAKGPKLVVVDQTATAEPKDEIT